MFNIVTVSYINTLPFIYSFKHSPFLKDIKFNLHILTPDKCAKSFYKGNYDFLLLPSGTVSSFLKNNYLPFGIIANKKVDSVLLLSNVPLENINNVIVDKESITSVKLFKILSKHYIKKKFVFINQNCNLLKTISNEQDAILIIGNKALLNAEKYKYCYDLAELWWNYTQLPFVFAYWVKKDNVDEEFSIKFEKALEWAIEHRNEAGYLCREIISEEKWLDYINNKIILRFTEESIASLNLYYTLLENNEY